MVENIISFLKQNLHTSLIGRNIYHYESLISTMDKARELAKHGAPQGTIVIAEKQTKGRGRLKRTWISTGDNIAISLILTPPFEKLPELVMISSVAVIRAIKRMSGLNSEIKWPNDIMIGNKKVCGILIENELMEKLVRFSIIGIGINVNLKPSSFPEISKIATSLSCELGRSVSCADLVLTLLEELENIYCGERQSISVYSEWKQYMYSIGKPISVQSGTDIEHGIAEDVTKEGNLILRKIDGTITEIFVGDVSVLKK